jgi:hypothetical protein
MWAKTRDLIYLVPNGLKFEIHPSPLNLVISISTHPGGRDGFLTSTIALSLVQSRLAAIFPTKTELEGETILVSFLTPPTLQCYLISSGVIFYPFSLLHCLSTNNSHFVLAPLNCFFFMHARTCHIMLHRVKYLSKACLSMPCHLLTSCLWTQMDLSYPFLLIRSSCDQDSQLFIFNWLMRNKAILLLLEYIYFEYGFTQ